MAALISKRFPSSPEGAAATIFMGFPISGEGAATPISMGFSISGEGAAAPISIRAGYQTQPYDTGPVSYCIILY